MNGELFGLAVQGLMRKKRSSLLLFAVLLLSFAFAIISLTVTGSIRATNEEYRWDTYGTWYGAIPNGRESDEAFLREQAWLDELGTCVSYGTILASSSGSTGIGVMDGTFLKIGRIGLQAGWFPENAGEIAMEADLLSALGYDYTIGQEITFTVSMPATAYISSGDAGEPRPQSVTVSVEQTFTLCGVLREYADLWVRSTGLFGAQPLNSAMITQDAADTLWGLAQEAAGEMRERWNEALKEEAEEQERVQETQVTGIVLDGLVPQYYFSVLPGSENEMTEQVNGYLDASRRNGYGFITGDTAVSVNTAAFLGGAAEEDAETFFAWLILGVTLLSVICIYAIRIQDEARQLATFRSIGITKRQLCVMLLYETLCLGVPAVILGVGAGALGIWALLRLAVYSGSVSVQVAIPPAMLAAAAALWLAGVLAVRLAVFLAALRAPLTGRFHVARKRARRYRNLRRALIAGLSVLMCTAVIFTVLESLGPYSGLKSVSGLYDYQISLKGYSGGYLLFTSNKTTGDEGYRDKGMTVPKQAVAPFVQIPGVDRVWGFSSEYIRLDFDGMDGVPLVNRYLEQQRRLDTVISGEGKTLKIPFGIGPYDPDAMRVFLLVADENDWGGIIDFDIDLEKFRAGDAVLMSFTIDSGGMFTSQEYDIGETFAETGLSVGDVIRITIGSPGINSETEVEVGGFSYLVPNEDLSLAELRFSYTVICSEAFLEKLLDSLGPDQMWNEHRQGTPYGYDKVYVYADMNAEYLSTDAVLAELCTREGLQLTSFRERNHSWVQEYLQTLILLLSGGGCVALVLLLILGNTLAMEAERQKRNYGILQALGMSRRQLGARQLGTALLRGALAALAGWLAYGGYCVAYGVQQRDRLLETVGEEYSVQKLFQQKINLLTHYYGSRTTLVLLTVSCVALVLLVSYLAKRRLFRDELMAKLRDEH